MTAGDSEPDLESILVDCLDAHDRGDSARLRELLQRHADHERLIRSALAKLGVPAAAPPDRVPDPDADTSRAPGRTLGEFELLDEIGRGGMGVVYEARQRSLGRRVALKVLNPLFALDAAAVERFQREGRAAARLQHAGVVPIFAVGQHDGCHWYAMEFVVGAPLQRLLERLRSLAPADLDGAAVGRLVAELAGDADGFDDRAWRLGYVETMVGIAIQLADALESVHAHGIVHRDVKPSNILIRPDGRALLVDFGLCRVDADPALTRSGGMLGTPGYMAPEQAADARAADARSDGFALAATLYEALTLRRAFDGSSDAEVIRALHETDPPDVRRVRPGAPRDLDAVLARALEKRPERRYRSLAAFAADLRAMLRHEPVTASRLTALGRLGRWRRRQPLQATIAALLVAGVPTVAALGGALWARRPLVAIAEERLRVERVEQALLDGVLWLLGGAPERALEPLAVARAAAPSELEVAALEAYALARAGRSASAFERIAAWPGPWPRPATRARVEAACHAALADRDRADQLARGLPEPAGLVELTAAAFAAIAATRERMDREALGRAQRWLEHAALLTPRPRPHLCFVLAQVTFYTHDEVTARAVADALALHWPDAAGAVLARAYATHVFAPAAAVPLYERALTLGVPEAVVRLAESAALEATGALAQAAAMLAAIPRTAPDHPEALYSLGRLAFAERDLDVAEARWREALAERPDFVDVAIGLGNVLTRRGEPARVVELLSPFVEHHPDLVRLRNNLGEALVASGDPEGALPHFDHAITCDPDYDYAFAGKTAALLALGRAEAAQAVALDAARQRPERGPRWRALALLHLEHEAMPGRDLALAVDALRRAVALAASPGARQVYRYDLIRTLYAARRVAELRPELEALLAELADADDENSRRIVTNLRRIQAVGADAGR
ncbi:MAG: protein kinase [Planctomycetes bacterium]|nr:protein kinase [Planctomycetota bacterium]